MLLRVSYAGERSILRTILISLLSEDQTKSGGRPEDTPTVFGTIELDKLFASLELAIFITFSPLCPFSAKPG
jgi:hypothetical protein